MSALSDKYPSIVRAYQQAFGRDPSDDEILSQTGGGSFSPNDSRIAFSVANIVAAGQGGTNTDVSLPKGIGSDAEVNQANEYARSQPWYQAMLKQWGQDPSNVKLSKDEQQTLLNQMRERGINVSDHFEVDASGNITPKSGLGKKILIGAAIGGAALTGLGLAGIGPMAGLFGGGTAAAAGGAEATAGISPELGMSAALPGALSTVPALGTAGAAGAAGAGAAGLAGVESGMSSALPGALETVPSLGGVLPSTAIGTGMSTLPAGLSSGTSAAGAAAAGAGSASKLAAALKAGDMATVRDILSAAGSGVSAATQAAGQNRLDQEKLALDASGQNIQGQSAFVNELLGMAGEEAKQRKSALGDVYRSSMAKTPRVSPFDPVGGPNLSQQYLDTAAAMGNQGAALLAKGPSYNVADMTRPTFTPIDIKNVPGATNTKPGTMEKIGQWLGPATSIGSKIIGLF